MDTSKAHLRPIVAGILKGVACTAICAAVLIPAVAAILLLTPDPGSVSAVAGYVILFISSLAGGIFASRSTGGGMLMGLMTGGAIALFVLLMSFIPLWDKSALSGALSVFLHLMPCAAGVLGGVLGKKPEKNLRRASKRRRRR